MSFIRGLVMTLFMWGWMIVFGVFAVLTLIHPRIAFYLSSLWVDGVIVAARIICGIRYEVRGREYLLEESAIYASKHQSAYDTFILWRLLKCPTFVIKKELLMIPVYGWYLSRIQLISIDRKAGVKMLPKMAELAKRFVVDGRKLVIFPEGTRTTPGEKVQYKTAGVKMLYKKLGVKVVPVATNSGLYWPKRGSKAAGTVVVQFLPPIEAGLPIDEFEKKLEEQIETASAALL